MGKEQVQLAPWFPRKHLDEDDWEVFVVGQQWERITGVRRCFCDFFMVQLEPILTGIRTTASSYLYIRRSERSIV